MNIFLDFLLNLCIRLNPKSSDKCLDFINELYEIVFFIKKKLIEVNYFYLFIFFILAYFTTKLILKKYIKFEQH